MPTQSAAGNPEFERYVRAQKAAFARNIPYHSIELKDGRVIPGIIPVEVLRARLEAFPIPRDLRGKRVLDIGAASGWNSFELERRGAQVVALDCVEYEEFQIARRLRESNVEYYILDIEEISPERLGTFDYVIFFGVFYHLRNPLLGLEKVCALTRTAAFVESYVIDDAPGGNCVMEFYERDELGGQIDNWCGPTTQCLIAMCRAAGFPRVDFHYVDGRRAGLTCRRRWEAAAAGDMRQAAPLLCFALNNRHFDPYFHPGKDEYVSISFQLDAPLERDDVMVQIDDYGVPPLILVSTGEATWQVNARMLPGLGPGRHSLRVGTARAGFSDSLAIFVLEPGAERPSQVSLFRPGDAGSAAPRLVAIENTLHHGTVFHGYRGEQLDCHFSSADQPIELSTVQLLVDGQPHPILALGRSRADVWQIKARLGEPLAEGSHSVQVRTAGSPPSEALAFTYEPDRTWQ